MRVTYGIKYKMREKLIVRCAFPHGDHPACPAVCSVPSPMGTTMCVNIVSKAKPTTMLYYNYNRFNNTSIITVSGNVVVVIIYA